MPGPDPTVVLPSSDLVEDDDVAPERASLLHAAASAPSIAMLTGTHGVVVPPLLHPDAKLPPARALVGPDPSFEAEVAEGESELVTLLRARAEAVDAEADPVGAARALLELARAWRDEDREDALSRAVEVLSRARAIAGAPVEAVEREMRAHLVGRGRWDEQLACVSALAEAASDPSIRADHLAERGRLLVARDEAWGEALTAHRDALALAPEHAAAAYGLEVAAEKTAAFGELARHLGGLAEATERAAAGGGGPDGGRRARAAAAWLLVERAALLASRLFDEAGARAALARALALDPGKGPVRDACVDAAVRTRDDAWLAELLEGEAALEADGARAAGLELDAALALARAAAPRERSIRLLERAFSRAPTSPLVDARVAEELARSLEEENRFADSLRVRKVALGRETEASAQLVALRAVATTASLAGELDEVVLALERARVLDADDTVVQGELDRALATAGRHQQRAVAWVRESALADDPERKAEALLEAARASRAAGRDDEARRHLRTAWITAPSAPGVYDALAADLVPAGGREAVAPRVALYEQALRSTSDPGRRVAWLEKIAWLWDDVAGDPALATRAYEEVLAIEPARPSAIAGLASSATRAGDDRALGRALLAEADVTTDTAARARLRLRAGEVLASVDPERALALAEGLVVVPAVAARARALATRIHEAAGRWELVASSLEARATAAEGAEAVHLLLAWADVLLRRLASPSRALEALASARARGGAADAALERATLEVLAELGDPSRTRAELEVLASATEDPQRRGALLVRLAELHEREPGGVAEALSAYAKARETVPSESLVAERVTRLTARAEAEGASERVHVVRRAARALETPQEVSKGLVTELLASASPDFATLRLAERYARRARAVPQLANALAMQAELGPEPLATRALAGLAELVAWTLPESDGIEPWDRLVERGSTDVTVLDELTRRARPLVAAGDPRATDLALAATERRASRARGDTEKVVGLLDLAALQRRQGNLRAAERSCSAALGHDPSSLTAAVWLASIAASTKDAGAGILAATSLAALCKDAKAASRLLTDAADLELARGQLAPAAALLERALTADPDAVLVAARLAEVQTRRAAWADLSRALRHALGEARSKEAIVPMASELATVARERLRDPLVAIEALERARSADPSHVPSRLVLAELYIGQRVWDRALEALGEVVERSTEQGERLVARTGRAAVLARGLGRPEDAEVELRAALELDPHDPRALRLLLDTAKGRMAGEERAALLSRLALTEPVAERRRLTLLELAEARKATGDADGMEGALIEAAALAPDPAMLERIRELTTGDESAFARVVARAIARARESGQATSPAWLARLGQIEADVLGRHDEAIGHLRDALEADPSRVELRPLLARVLVSTGQNPEAATELMPLFASPAGAAQLDGLTLRLLEAALLGAGRPAEARVARELRAIAGTMDARERASLEVPQGGLPSEAGALSADVLRGLLPTLGRHPIWSVAQLAVGLGGKLSRVALTDLGSTAKERVKPRAPHALRPPFERALRVFGLTEVELAVSEAAPRVAIAMEDEPWLVVPASLADAPDAVFDAAVAGPLTLLALGVPWADTLGPDDVLGALVAVARQVAPSFASPSSPAVEGAADAAELRARRAIDRRRKRALEDMRDALDAASALAERAFVEELSRVVARVALLVTGDLRAGLRALGRAQPDAARVLATPGPGALAAVVASPLARDLLAFSLGGEATGQRRRLGFPL